MLARRERTIPILGLAAGVDGTTTYIYNVVGAAITTVTTTPATDLPPTSNGTKYQTKTQTNHQ